MRRYVEVRLEFYEAGNDQKKLREVRDKTERLQNQLWAHGVAMGEKDLRAVTTGLFLQSLNETIDLHAKRLTALENHVPEITLVLLYFVAIDGNRTDRLWMRAIRAAQFLRDDHIVDPYRRGDYGDYRSRPATAWA